MESARVRGEGGRTVVYRNEVQLYSRNVEGNQVELGGGPSADPGGEKVISFIDEKEPMLCSLFEGGSLKKRHHGACSGGPSSLH